MENKMIRMRWMAHLLVACSFFAACSEEDLKPSNIDSTSDFFVLKNDPNADALDRLRYDIYAGTDCTVFYNDTLGSETREGSGGPYTYYEKYKCGYQYVAIKGEIYSLSYDRDLLLEFLEMYNERVHSVIASSPYTKMRGILLVDSLRGSTADKIIWSFVRDDHNSMLVLSMLREVRSAGDVRSSNGEPFKGMSDERKADYMETLLLEEILDGMKAFKLFLDACTQEEIKGFFDATLTATTYPKKKAKIYGQSFNTEYKVTSSGNSEADSVGMEVFDSSEPRKFGFLQYKSVTDKLPTGAPDGNPEYRSCWMRDQDAKSFLTLMRKKTDAEIREEYKDWEVVLRKYELMRKFLIDNKLEGWLKKE